MNISVSNKAYNVLKDMIDQKENKDKFARIHISRFG